MSVYIPKRQHDDVCKMVPTLILETPCRPGECEKCGWNPEVHVRRLKALWTISSQGKLREWGKTNERFTTTASH